MSLTTDLFLRNRERWHLTKIDDKTIKALSESLNIEFLLAKILLARQIGQGSVSEIERFLNPPQSMLLDYQYLSDPAHLERATSRIKLAISNGEQVLVNGDPDADGISGASILTAGLRHLGANVSYDFPVRSKEGHGLQTRIVDSAIEQGIKLIITTDCGSKDIETTKYANDHGIEVIITDHHILGKTLPPALALINPQLCPGKTGFKCLSGAGVAFKFIVACFVKMGLEIPKVLLDFMTVSAMFGTLSDRMTMLEPMNRILIREGVLALMVTKREGLKGLKRVCMDDPDTFEAHDLSRSIIPRLNAPGRIGDRFSGIPDSTSVVDLMLIGMGQENAKMAEELSEKLASAIDMDKQMRYKAAEGESSELDAVNRASNVDDINERRKYLTSKIEEEIDKLLEEQTNPEKDRIIVVQGNNWNSGVIGIDTDRLKERFLRPAMIITRYPGSDYLRASVRSIPSIDMYSVLDGVESRFKDQFSRGLFRMEVESQEGMRIVSAFGGHAQACGFTVHQDDLDVFLEMLKEEMKNIPEKDFEYAYDIIDKVNFSQLNIKFINKLKKLGPYGQQFEYPIFYLPGCHLSKGRSFGNKYQETRKPHLRFRAIEVPKKHRVHVPLEVECVGFGLWDKFCSLKSSEDVDTTYDLIFTFEKTSSGKKKKRFFKPGIRLNVMDIRKSGKNVDSFLIPNTIVQDSDDD